MKFMSKSLMVSICILIIITSVSNIGYTDNSMIALGAHHTVIVKSDGTVWAWGDNNWGELGDGTTEDSLFPVKSMEEEHIIAVAASNDYTLALKSNGTVLGWGYDYNHYLVTNNTNLSGIIAIDTGGNHAAALKSDGTVWAWGDNRNGQLGNGSTKDSRDSPVLVENLLNVVAISAGGDYTVALKSDGTVWTWGVNCVLSANLHELKPIGCYNPLSFFSESNWLISKLS